MDTSCCGMCKNNKISRLPFPQDRILKVVHTSGHQESDVTKVWFLPVPEQPLSSNRYFIILAKGRHKGKAYTCSREADIETCCFHNVRVDLAPKPLEKRDIYQQVEVRAYHNGTFYALPVAGDGCLPKFLRRKGWEVYTTHSFKLYVRETQGLYNSSLSQLPELDVPLLPKRSTPVIIGRWYCPFVFIKERIKVKEQMKKSLFYEWTLKQWWEKIYSSENDGSVGNVVAVSACVKRLVTLVYGMEAEEENRRMDDGFIWFRAKDSYRTKASVGLDLTVYEKLIWLQEKRGWLDAGLVGDGDVRVEGTKEITSETGWRRFGCYILVESFVLRESDGSLVINFNFKNTDKIECKLE